MLIVAATLCLGQSHPSKPRSAPSKPLSREFTRLAKQADIARGANQIERALLLYERALKLNPQWQEGWWYVGTLHYDADRYSQATFAFRNLTTLNPKLGAPWAMMGLCEFESGDYKNAMVHMSRGRARGLGTHQELLNAVVYHQALLLTRSGQFEAATELLNALVVRGLITESVRMALGLALLRVPLLPNHLDSSKDAEIRSAGEAAVAIALNNFDQAREAFQGLLKDYPKTPFVHYAYGAMLSSLSKFEEADREFRAEMTITPESALPYMHLTYIYLRTSRPQEALPLVEKGVELAPQSFAVHYLRGRTLLDLGKLDAAIASLERARRLGPFSPDVRYSLAKAYTRARRIEDAKRERVEFARLTALLDRKEKVGGQSYRSSSERATLNPRVADESAEPLPDKLPE